MRGIDDGGEIIDTVHSQIGDCESTALIFVGFQFTFSSSTGESFGFGRDGSKALGPDVFDDRSDETVRCGNCDTDVGPFIPVLRDQLSVKPSG